MWNEICDVITLDGSNPMKTAKEMFEELGLVYSIYTSAIIVGEITLNDESMILWFDKDDRKLSSKNVKRNLDTELHLAITQQMKELGWIE